MMPKYSSMIVSMACLLRFALGSGVPEGWRMSDRFLSFRYELTCTPESRCEEIKIAIRDKADLLFCFGWVQDSVNYVTLSQTIVGEARCKKHVGYEMKSFLSSVTDQVSGEIKDYSNTDGAAMNNITFRVYDDTLIRLHFSDFKIVSPGRNTCFRDEPHKCAADKLLESTVVR